MENPAFTHSTIPLNWENTAPQISRFGDSKTHFCSYIFESFLLGLQRLHKGLSKIICIIFFNIGLSNKYKKK